MIDSISERLKDLNIYADENYITNIKNQIQNISITNKSYKVTGTAMSLGGGATGIGISAAALVGCAIATPLILSVAALSIIGTGIRVV